MPEVRLDILLDAHAMNAEQIANVQKAMQQLGLSAEQTSTRTQAALAQQERTTPVMRAAAGATDEASRASAGLTGRLGTLQNALSNAMVNASMGGNAFSNLAWGLMFSPTSAAVAATGVATALYAAGQVMITAVQHTQEMAEASRDFAAKNHISMEEANAILPVMEAYGVKTQDLTKAKEQLITILGSEEALNQEFGEAAVRGAVMTDQQTAAALRQQQAVARLGLEWDGFLNKLSSNTIGAQQAALQGASSAAEGLGAATGVLNFLFPSFSQNQSTAAIQSQNFTNALARQNVEMQKSIDAATTIVSAELREQQSNLAMREAIHQAVDVQAKYADQARDLALANDRVKVAEDSLKDAVAKHGADSLQAEKAELALKVAREAVIDVTNRNSDASFQLERSELAARQAILNVAAAALQGAQQQASLTGGQLSAVKAAQVQVVALSAVRDTLAPGSPLRVWLDAYIKQLENIPGYVHTYVVVDHIVRQSDRIGAAGGIQIVSAEGAVFTRPTLTWVAERGEEAVVPKGARPGYMAPGASPLPGGMGGGEWNDRRIVQMLERVEAAVYSLDLASQTDRRLATAFRT